MAPNNVTRPNFVLVMALLGLPYIASGATPVTNADADCWTHETNVNEGINNLLISF
jgi:hypothetical protein